MATTIQSLRRALDEPQSHFATLGKLKCSGSCIVRSTHFAEVEIEWQDESWLLLMPLNSHAMRRLERFSPKRLHLSSEIIPHILILKDEMLCECAAGQHRCDIVLEKLPKALVLKDAIASLSSPSEAHEIISSIETLEEELKLLGVSHNNLCVDNLRLSSDNKLYPIRWYYATTDNAGDRDTLKALKELVLEQTQSMELHDKCASYSTPPLEATHYKDFRLLHEGLLAFETEEGWGFMDAERRVIIEPQYLWVNDFREGRAEVQTPQGMGLIDKEGRSIIPARYEIVDYNHLSGNTEVCYNGEWALFDYQGVIIAPWGEYEIEL